MVVAAAIFVVCILLAIAVHRRESGRAVGRKSEEAEKPLGKEGGFQLIIRSPYLRWIALMILLLNVVNTTGWLPAQQVQCAGGGQGSRRGS